MVEQTQQAQQKQQKPQSQQSQQKQQEQQQQQAQQQQTQQEQTQQEQQEQQEQQRSFLKKILDQSGLERDNDAQVAAKVVFRILRDLMPKQDVDQVAAELHTEAPRANMDIADLWNDTNVMIAFFSRISPVQQLPIGSDTFLLRLQEEAVLPTNVEPSNVARAVFSALQDELPESQSDQIARYLPDGIRQLW